MRVISGTYRSKIITAPADLPVRPTTDFAKTGLFNILQSNYNFHLLNVLDLFSGTGNISYEFISRGCKSLVAVDNNSMCTNFIRTTFDKLNITIAQVKRKDAVHFLQETHQTFDIIFADPPYDLTIIEELHNIIFEKQLLTKKGMFVFEHESSKDYNEMPFFTAKRKYGTVAFSFFKTGSNS